MTVTDELQGSIASGKVIAGRFRVERLIGRGGMGEVYAARNIGTGRSVALKLIRGAVDAEQTRRFLREAKAATAIQHPNVIEVLDVFEDEDKTPVMVMELLQGEPLSARRKREGALPLHEVARLIMPVAAALRAAHQKKIVHRDLKPDNIFLARSGGGACVPKVLDFGIAKVLDPVALNAETQGGNTSTGSILGTPHYMSFEQAMSEKDIDHRADIWAMGVIVFEALTGTRPLVFETLGEMYTAFLQREVPSIQSAVPDLPADIASVIDHCLQKRREARLGDLGPLIDVLTRYTDPGTPGALAGGKVIGALTPASAAMPSVVTGAPMTGEPRGAPSGSRRWLAALAAVVGLAVVGGTVARLRSRAPEADLTSAAPSVSAPAIAALVSTALPAPSAAATDVAAARPILRASEILPLASVTPSAASLRKPPPRAAPIPPKAPAASASAPEAPPPSAREAPGLVTTNPFTK